MVSSININYFKHCYYWQVQGKNDILSIKKYMYYQDGLQYFNRKKDKFDMIESK